MMKRLTEEGKRAEAVKPAAAKPEDCAACPNAENCRGLRDGRGFMPHARIMFFAGR